MSLDMGTHSGKHSVPVESSLSAVLDSGRGEFSVRLPARLLTAVAVAVAVVAAMLPSTALAGARNGVPQYNTKVCGTNWVSIRTKQSYFSVYNDDFGRETCFEAERHHLDFQIIKAQPIQGFYSYPNISSGWESGRYSCAYHRGSCYTYPVKVSRDGNPVMSMAGWLAPGRYDFSFDVWTFPKYVKPVPVFDTGGTELMIWLAHPGVPENLIRTVRIDGIEWDVTTWLTHRDGTSWRLLIYYAVHPRSSVYGLHLNDFFREAEANGEMTANYWLTGINAGFEMVQGGVHDNIHYYSLTGVGTGGCPGAAHACG